MYSPRSIRVNNAKTPNEKVALGVGSGWQVDSKRYFCDSFS